MACPSCGQQGGSWRTDDVTHDTLLASCHISTATWLRQLDDAVKSAWSRRRGAYSQATVLMLSWQESDMRYADQELARLQSVFEDLYHYTVENWRIPSEKPRQAATRKYLQFAEDHGASDSLLVVYYAGHARATSGQSPIWHSRREGGFELDSTAILSQLATPGDDGDDAPDILLVQDCCHPLSAYRSQGKPTNAVVECLYSGGFESEAPIAGPDSFTAGLTQELAQAVSLKTSIRVTELHSRLIKRFETKQSSIIFDTRNRVRMRGDRAIMTKQDKTTPSHTFLADAKPPRSIILSPLPDKSLDHNGRVESETSDGSSDSFSWPKVMITVRLVEDETVAEELKQWLLSAPRGVVEFEGIIPSSSSILLVAIPVVVWDLLPPCSAVSFLGFIRGPEGTGPAAQDPDDQHTIPVLGHNRTRGKSMPWKDTAMSDDESLASTKASLKAPKQEVRIEDDFAAKPTDLNQGIWDDTYNLIDTSRQTSEFFELLDLIDTSWPHVYREWKFQEGYEAGKTQDVLFDIFDRFVRDGGYAWENRMGRIAAHQDVLGRLLSAYDLLEESHSTLNTRKRLVNKMKHIEDLGAGDRGRLQRVQHKGKASLALRKELQRGGSIKA